MFVTPNEKQGFDTFGPGARYKISSPPKATPEDTSGNVSIELNLAAVGAWALLAGFVTVLALPTWWGVGIGAACLLMVLVLDLVLVRHGQQAVSQWLWGQFSGTQCWLLLMVAAACGTARIWMRFGAFAGCLAGVLMLYYIVAGHREGRRK